MALGAMVGGVLAGVAGNDATILAMGLLMLGCGGLSLSLPERRRLADALTCIREKCRLDEAGERLEINGERHLKSAAAMAELFADYPQALARSLAIVEACRGFRLRDLKYEYPDEPIPPGKTAQQHLTDLVAEGLQRRYPLGAPDKVLALIRKELALIEKLDFARYFLTVHDVVAYARNEAKILCQGRGSAANSAVCFCLGITEVDPSVSTLRFSRFISGNRGEPRDIDVDF